MVQPIRMTEGGYKSVGKTIKNISLKDAKMTHKMTPSLSEPLPVKTPDIGTLTWADFGNGVNNLLAKSKSKLLKLRNKWNKINGGH